MITNMIRLIQQCTDEAVAAVVVTGTMASYFVGVNVPSEAMMLVLGYYFTRAAAKKPEVE